MIESCRNIFQTAFNEKDSSIKELSLELTKKAHEIQDKSNIDLSSALVVGKILTADNKSFPLTLELAKKSELLSSMTLEDIEA